jgi:hypothetical protein
VVKTAVPHASHRVTRFAGVPMTRRRLAVQEAAVIVRHLLQA